MPYTKVMTHSSDIIYCQVQLNISFVRKSYANALYDRNNSHEEHNGTGIRLEYK
jgi:hypothetical protein